MLFDGRYGELKACPKCAVENGKTVRHATLDRGRVGLKEAAEFLDNNVFVGSTIHTDEAKIYSSKLVEANYNHGSVRHIWHEYVKDGVTTNHAENFFGQFKTSTLGTYHAVSHKYLNSYVAEFAFRYNHRREPIFSLLMAKAVKRAG